MGFLQIGKNKKSKKKKSLEEQWMIRSSSKKSTSSTSTSSLSPSSPVDEFVAAAEAAAVVSDAHSLGNTTTTTSTTNSKRKSGLFRTPLLLRRGSSTTTTASRARKNAASANTTSIHRTAAATLAAAVSPADTAATVDEHLGADDDAEDNVNHNETRTAASVLSSLYVLPTSLLNETTANYVYDEEDDEEEDSLHYSPSPRRSLRYDNEENQQQQVNESYEIVMSHLDETPLMHNRSDKREDKLLSIATSAATTRPSSLLSKENDYYYDDDDDIPFDAKADSRQTQAMTEDPTISEFSETEAESKQQPMGRLKGGALVQAREVQSSQPPNLVTPDIGTTNETTHKNNNNKSNKTEEDEDDENLNEAYYKALLGTPAHTVRRRLIDVFNCVTPADGDTMSVVSGTGNSTVGAATTTTLPFHLPTSPRRHKVSMMDFFYDTVCCAPDVTKTTKKRPFFSEQFALEFLRKMVYEGFPLLYLQPSSKMLDTTVGDNKSEEDDWTGESVTMRIRPGDLSNAHQTPRLEWSTWGGGCSHPNVRTTTLDLLQIHSIMDHEAAMENTTTNKESHSLFGELQEEPQEDVYAFTITSQQGEVHMFEASTQNERDQVVCGLKNVVARLSFQLVTGDSEHVADEWFRTSDGNHGSNRNNNINHESNNNNGSSNSGELPPLVTPRQAIHNMEHSFLD